MIINFNITSFSLSWHVLRNQGETTQIIKTLLQSLNAFYASKKCYFHKNKFLFSLYFLMLHRSSLNKILIMISNIFQYLWWNYWFQLTTNIETITLFFLHPETQDHSVSTPSLKMYQIQARAASRNTYIQHISAARIIKLSWQKRYFLRNERNHSATHPDIPCQ